MGTQHMRIRTLPDSTSQSSQLTPSTIEVWAINGTGKRVQVPTLSEGIAILRSRQGWELELREVGVQAWYERDGIRPHLGPTGALIEFGKGEAGYFLTDFTLEDLGGHGARIDFSADKSIDLADAHVELVDLMVEMGD